MAASADIDFEREDWQRPLAWSVALHAFFFGGVFLFGFILGGFHGESWGGVSSGGGAMSATLVSTVPLPRREVQTENLVANESAGLSQSLPKVKEQTPDALPIPERDTPKKPKPLPATAQPPEVVPFGQGGPVSGPYGAFVADGAKGGFGFSGGGDFGTRYAWYVRVVREKVSQNWMKYEIDPGIRSARRVYIVFDILRNGRPEGIQIEQSSGIPSLDQSALRALQRIDTFGPLPSDYSGSKVSVEFWFDYQR
ncbi:MAG: energy transducer TonB [Terriglobales bacterium]